MKILIADDDRISLLLLQRILEKEGYEAIAASDGEEAWEKYKRNSVPMTLLDWMMPKMDGVEVCRRIRDLESNSKAYCYIIMITAKTQTEDLTEALEAGADDFVSKPYDRGVLSARIRAGKRIIEGREKLRESEERYRELSMIDELTRLYNRRYFFDSLKLEISRSQRYGYPLSIAILDIDRFKDYNDSYGHVSGDELLKSFAGIIKTKIRKSDIACRYGGDEFVIMLPRADASQAREVVGRISSELGRANREQKIVAKASLGLSAGIAQYPQDTEDKEHLISLADTALYQSKKLGKARITLASELEELSKNAVGHP